MSKPISRTEQSKSYSPSISTRRSADNAQSFESLLKPADSNTRDSKPVNREEPKPKEASNHETKQTSEKDHPHIVPVHAHSPKDSSTKSSEEKSNPKTEAVANAPTTDGGFDWSAKQTGPGIEELAKASADALNDIVVGDNDLTTGGKGKTSPVTNKMIRPAETSGTDVDPGSAAGDPQSPGGKYDILSVQMITANNSAGSGITGLATGHADVSSLILSNIPAQKTSIASDPNPKIDSKPESVSLEAQAISLSEVKTQTDSAGGFGQSKGDQNDGSFGTLVSKIELPNETHSKTGTKENSFAVAQEAAMTATSKQVTADHQPQSVTGPQIIEQLAAQVKPSMTELRMVIRPDDMGTLNLKVSTENGRIVASILASSDSVKQALEQHLPQLHAALSQAGLKVSSVSVDTQTSQFSQSMMSDGNQSSGQNAMPGKSSFNNSRIEAKVESVVAPISRPSVSTSNSLNILA